MATYRIHPGLGIARLGNSTTDFCITPEQPAMLPVECDSGGNPVLLPDGGGEARITKFKDGEGRLKRQAARFQVYVYDDESPEGRPLKLKDRVEGGGNAGTLIDIQWRVWLANKKSSWYEYNELDGEHGYSSPVRRNASVEGDARQQLIIDPGPRTVDQSTPHATFDRNAGIQYAPTFPPELQPLPIDTLGEILTDKDLRLLVLGGLGNSGSWQFNDFGQPRINNFVNNDGWFDDTSDGPIMARLVFHSELVNSTRFIDVESPSWVICGSPAYVPPILNIVTVEDVVENMAVTQFASRPEIYGAAGTFENPQLIPPTDEGSLVFWRAGRLQWNSAYRPWFWRDIWPILFRPDQYSYLCDVLNQSNYPHNQSTRGTFDPYKLSVTPEVNWAGVRACERECIARHQSGETFVDTFEPVLLTFDQPVARRIRSRGRKTADEALSVDLAGSLRKAAAAFAAAVVPDPGDELGEYLRRWRTSDDSPAYPAAKAKLEATIKSLLDALDLTENLGRQIRRLTFEHLQKFLNGKLIEDCRDRCIATNTYDPYRQMRTFLFDLLRAPGQENQFAVADKPQSRVFNLPLMPLLCGDNPISNLLPSKFLRLTDYQYYVLRQWAAGLFYNEVSEGWLQHVDPWWPYGSWVNRAARDLDRAVLMNMLGGAFCPGGEVGWVIRNPSIWREPYRIKADPNFYRFAQTAAQANQNFGNIAEVDYSSYTIVPLSQDNNFDTGLQPGDLTKSMALPWQADFNECSTQNIDVTYELWNSIDPGSDHDSLTAREQRMWETLWWPAHRPMQTYELTSNKKGASPVWMDWTPGVPQTNAGDLKMVTEWWRLPFVVRSATVDPKPTPAGPAIGLYFSKERTKQ